MYEQIARMHAALDSDKQHDSQRAEIAAIKHCNTLQKSIFLFRSRYLSGTVITLYKTAPCYLFNGSGAIVKFHVFASIAKRKWALCAIC